MKNFKKRWILAFEANGGFDEVLSYHVKFLAEKNPEDVLCTFVELTVRKIEEYFNFCGTPAKVIFHGGGTENKYLMKRIKEMIKTEISTIDSLISSKSLVSASANEECRNEKNPVKTNKTLYLYIQKL